MTSASATADFAAAQPETLKSPPGRPCNGMHEGFNRRIKQLNARYKDQQSQTAFFYKLSSRLIPLVEKSIVTRLMLETEREIKQHGIR
jgi:hypothetical protein